MRVGEVSGDAEKTGERGSGGEVESKLACRTILELEGKSIYSMQLSGIIKLRRSVVNRKVSSQA